jgi:hypothetical protein
VLMMPGSERECGDGDALCVKLADWSSVVVLRGF